MGKGRFKRALRRVNAAFDAERLIDICERDEQEFEEFGEPIDCGQGKFYIYKDNDTDILAVAHLDTVQQDRGATVTQTKTGSKLVLSGALDDRLGAYVILDLLPKLGVKVDWLLTTGEESASTTAVEFVSDQLADPQRKRYKWMFQFDRTGTDVVLYDYDNAKTRELVRSVGFTVGEGLFSDISEMEEIGCAGFNFGVGYQDYHSPRAYAWLDDTFAQVARFLRFYAKYGTRMIPHAQVMKWHTGEFTSKDGTKHTYRYRDKWTGWDDEPEDWEAMRDEYLASHGKRSEILRNDAHPMPGTLSYSDRECLCWHIESMHDGNQGECDGPNCGCSMFVPYDYAEDQEASLAGTHSGYN